MPSEPPIPGDLRVKYDKCCMMLSAYREEEPDLSDAPIASMALSWARCDKELIERIARLERIIAARKEPKHVAGH